MRDIAVFSVRDLRLSSSELVREAEAGQVSIITKQGKPAVLALPFGSRLLDMGLDKDLALALFERRLITMAKAVLSITLQRSWRRSYASRSDLVDRVRCRPNDRTVSNRAALVAAGSVRISGRSAHRRP